LHLKFFVYECGVPTFMKC